MVYFHKTLDLTGFDTLYFHRIIPWSKHWSYALVLSGKNNIFIFRWIIVKWSLVQNWNILQIIILFPDISFNLNKTVPKPVTESDPCFSFFQSKRFRDS